MLRLKGGPNWTPWASKTNIMVISESSLYGLNLGSKLATVLGYSFVSKALADHEARRTIRLYNLLVSNSVTKRYTLIWWALMSWLSTRAGWVAWFFPRNGRRRWGIPLIVWILSDHVDEEDKLNNISLSSLWQLRDTVNQNQEKTIGRYSVTV